MIVEGQSCAITPIYRAANGRAQAGVSIVVCLTTAGRKAALGGGLPFRLPNGSIGSCSFTVSARVGGTSDEWIGIHTNGIHTIPMEYIRNGMEWYPLQCKGLHTNAPVTAVGCSGPG